MSSIPGSGRSPGGGHGSPLQYSCLENPIDRGAWWVIGHKVEKSQTRLSDEHFYAFMYITNIYTCAVWIWFCVLSHGLVWSAKDPYPVSAGLCSAAVGRLFLQQELHRVLLTACCPAVSRYAVQVMMLSSCHSSCSC